MEKLAKIQRELKAPKDQVNAFGKYKYRSCEDILEAVKPLLDGAVLTLSDEVVEVGGRIYVKATATFLEDDSTYIATAFAREPEDRKGMDASQITGAASSYARKYALNGLFLIDDTKDADGMDNTKDDKEASETDEDATQAPKDDIKDFITPSQLAIVDGYLKKLNLNRDNLGTWLVAKGKILEPDVTKLTQDAALQMVRQWEPLSTDILKYCLNNRVKGETND